MNNISREAVKRGKTFLGKVGPSLLPIFLLLFFSLPFLFFRVGAQGSVESGVPADPSQQSSSSSGSGSAKNSPDSKLAQTLKILSEILDRIQAQSPLQTGMPSADTVAKGMEETQKAAAQKLMGGAQGNYPFWRRSNNDSPQPTQPGILPLPQGTTSPPSSSEPSPGEVKVLPVKNPDSFNILPAPEASAEPSTQKANAEGTPLSMSAKNAGENASSTTSPSRLAGASPNGWATTPSALSHGSTQDQEAQTALSTLTRQDALPRYRSLVDRFHTAFCTADQNQRCEKEGNFPLCTDLSSENPFNFCSKLKDIICREACRVATEAESRYGTLSHLKGWESAALAEQAQILSPSAFAPLEKALQNFEKYVSENAPSKEKQTLLCSLLSAVSGADSTSEKSAGSPPIFLSLSETERQKEYQALVAQFPKGEAQIAQVCHDQSAQTDEEGFSYRTKSAIQELQHLLKSLPMTSEELQRVQSYLVSDLFKIPFMSILMRVIVTTTDKMVCTSCINGQDATTSFSFLWRYFLFGGQGVEKPWPDHFEDVFSYYRSNFLAQTYNLSPNPYYGRDDVLTAQLNKYSSAPETLHLLNSLHCENLAKIQKRNSQPLCQGSSCPWFDLDAQGSSVTALTHLYPLDVEDQDRYKTLVDDLQRLRPFLSTLVLSASPSKTLSGSELLAATESATLFPEIYQILLQLRARAQNRYLDWLSLVQDLLNRKNPDGFPAAVLENQCIAYLYRLLSTNVWFLGGNPQDLEASLFQSEEQKKRLEEFVAQSRFLLPLINDWFYSLFYGQEYSLDNVLYMPIKAGLDYLIQPSPNKAGFFLNLRGFAYLLSLIQYYINTLVCTFPEETRLNSLLLKGITYSYHSLFPGFPSSRGAESQPPEQAVNSYLFVPQLISTLGYVRCAIEGETSFESCQQNVQQAFDKSFQEYKDIVSRISSPSEVQALNTVLQNLKDKQQDSPSKSSWQELSQQLLSLQGMSSPPGGGIFSILKSIIQSLGQKTNTSPEWDGYFWEPNEPWEKHTQTEDILSSLLFYSADQYPKNRDQFHAKINAVLKQCGKDLAQIIVQQCLGKNLEPADCLDNILLRSPSAGPIIQAWVTGTGNRQTIINTLSFYYYEKLKEAKTDEDREGLFMGESGLCRDFGSKYYPLPSLPTESTDNPFGDNPYISTQELQVVEEMQLLKLFEKKLIRQDTLEKEVLPELKNQFLGAHPTWDYEYFLRRSPDEKKKICAQY